MNEVINIGFGLEATVLATVIFIIRSVVFLYAIIMTITTLRNLAILAGMEASNKKWKWQRSATLVPAITWFIFWLLTLVQTEL